MNGPKYRQEKKIFQSFDIKYQLDNINLLGDLLHLYILAYEDGMGLLRNYCITNEPFDDIEDVKTFNEKYYKKIREKLIYYTENYTIFLDKPKLISKILSAYGFILEYGLFDVEIDKNKAKKYYEFSAIYGSPFGTFRLAQCHEKGVGCKKNLKEAVVFYRCAAKLGFLQGIHTFGTIVLRNKFNLEFDDNIGYFYLHLGVNIATRLYPFVCFDYARNLELDLSPTGHVSDIMYCFKMYNKGAEIDCPNCQLRVAQCYEYGELECEIDLEKSYSYYKKASFNGNIDASVKVAQIYIEPKEMHPPNFELSYKYAIRAAIKGNCMAMLYIIIFYENGLGVDKNLLVAKWWQRIFLFHLKNQSLDINMKIFTEITKTIFYSIENSKKVNDDVEIISECIEPREI
ncbi:chitin synthase regulator [Vairimorpha necatrix]|uniref:Chitin synthase regulator n=1 Tax=Vairimorpha necatrix TaxID=6039 RepID=A0AAX4JB19_9MICR